MQSKIVRNTHHILKERINFKRNLISHCLLLLVVTKKSPIFNLRNFLLKTFKFISIRTVSFNVNKIRIFTIFY